MVCSCGVVSKGCYICACNIKRLHFGVNFGIEREHCLSIEWVWSIPANAGCHEQRLYEYSNEQVRSVSREIFVE